MERTPSVTFVMVVSSNACLSLRLFSPVLLSFLLPVYSALIISLRVAVFFSVWFLVTGDQLSLVFLDPCEIKDEFIEVVEYDACCRQLFLPCAGHSALEVATLLNFRNFFSHLWQLSKQPNVFSESLREFEHSLISSFHHCPHFVVQVFTVVVRDR